MEFLADKEDWEDDGPSADNPPENGQAGDASDEEPQEAAPLPPSHPKRHKKLAKAIAGKRARDRRVTLAFEPAEEEKQLN